MRIVSFLAALALAALTFGACNVAPVVGSGDLVSQEFVVDDFDRIEIDGAWEASITAGELQSVVVLVDDNLMQHVDVKVDDGRLQVELDRTTIRSTTAVSITVPSLDKVEVNGAAAVSVEGLDAYEFETELNGAGTLTVNGGAEQFNVEVNGAGTFVAVGHSSTIDLEVNGASTVNLAEWEVRTADVDVNGASNVTLTGADAVSGSINGVANLTVDTKAVLDVDSSGLSDIHRQ